MSRQSGCRTPSPPLALLCWCMVGGALSVSTLGHSQTVPALAHGQKALAAFRGQTAAGPRRASAARSTTAPEWCAPELETLADGICAYLPGASEPKTETSKVDSEQAEFDSSSGEHESNAARNVAPAKHDLDVQRPRTLILFLHSLVPAASDWQWEQQRTVLQVARKYGFAALLPRGRKGIGPGRAPETWAWPTSTRAQEELEDDLVQEWTQARAALERRTGAPFERLLVFGFSNGAYYASSLALRGRLEADGYAAFSGGSGGKYAAVLGAHTTRRAPIFIGYGSKDAAREDMRSLDKTLRQLGWRHRAREEAVGHIVTPTQLRHAVLFLTAPPRS